MALDEDDPPTIELLHSLLANDTAYTVGLQKATGRVFNCRGRMQQMTTAGGGQASQKRPCTPQPCRHSCRQGKAGPRKRPGLIGRVE